MKAYTITVNGTAYEVEVEEKGGAVAAAPRAAAPAPRAAAPAPKAAPAPAPAPAAKPVAAGAAAVKSGQVLLILEAMKMQNEIMAPADGTIADVRVSAGSTVNTGDVMIVM